MSREGAVDVEAPWDMQLNLDGQVPVCTFHPYTTVGLLPSTRLQPRGSGSIPEVVECSAGVGPQWSPSTNRGSKVRRDSPHSHHSTAYIFHLSTLPSSSRFHFLPRNCWVINHPALVGDESGTPRQMVINNTVGRITKNAIAMHRMHLG